MRAFRSTRRRGDTVSAATLNQSGFLTCEATRVGEDTTLSQIIQMVSDAAATKAPIAKVADRVSGIFVPAVITIAILTIIGWLLAGQSVGFALARGISVLVISCPCALGLATPVAIMVGNGMGAKHGIMFKTAVSLENALKKQLGSKDAAKKYILELYLNTIPLHHGLRGVEAASQYYFGKHASELTLAEAASIAGITKTPSLYAPDMNEEESRKRQLTVLQKMLDLGMITQAEYDEAAAEDIYAHLVCKETAEEESNAKHNWFVEAAVQQIKADLMEKKNMTAAQASNMIYSGGLQIHTTMDASMQETAEAAMKNDNMFPAGDGKMDVTYLISVLDTQNPDESSNQSHYEKKTTVTSQEEADAFVASVKEELLDETHTLVLDKLTVSKSLQAAMVIMDQSNGEVKAIVGGRGEKPGDSVFNRATQALRQQGSTMKPLAAYAPAIDTGLLMPGSIIIDEPVTYGGWSPKNWDGKYIGPTTVRQGIWHSMNVLAVKTFMMVGADTAYQYLLDFGFTTIDERDKAATTALGGLTQGVSVLEQTAAYATIANGGTYYEPMFYSVVYDHDGNVLLDNSEQETHRVLKETTAFLLTDMMRDVITKGTGTKAAISGMNVAGKTGTTNDTVDLTFYGYTPYYTAGIWMGYDSQKEIINANNAHLRIWSSVMSQIHYDKGLKNKEFKKPDGLTTRSICSASGMTPSSLCNSDYYGYGVTSDYVTTDFQGQHRRRHLHDAQILYDLQRNRQACGRNLPDHKCGFGGQQ